MPIYRNANKGLRATWNQNELLAALNDVKQNTLSINAAAKLHKIQATTLRRRLKSESDKKPSLGAPTNLGVQNEQKIVDHIEMLQMHGFAPNRKELRRMAFELAEKYKVSHNFNRAKKLAGVGWFQLFLHRHPELSVRKSEGVSISRANVMEKEEVSKYFKLLEDTLICNEIVDKPGNLFNMDETGCQLNNRPEYVIAQKGSRNVAAVTSAERGETITVIACCNAEGSFLPPACVFKGIRKKLEWEDGMPPGSVVYMGEKSAYINKNIFFTWLKEHFILRKPIGNVLLLLDGHSLHTNIEMLEYAALNDVILFCLPPQTTQFLQPLDRAFFKPFKSFVFEACNTFIRTNPEKKNKYIAVRQAFVKCLGKSSYIKNGISGFSSTGIFPFNPEIIPEYAYINHHCEDQPAVPIIAPVTSPTLQDSTAASTSQEAQVASDITPGKMLQIISLVPSRSKPVFSLRKQKARVLTSEQSLLSSKKPKIKKDVGTKPKKNKKQELNFSTSDEENITIQFQDESGGPEDFGENTCAGCGEDYNATKKRDEWMQCIMCGQWSHGSCTQFKNTCDNCGKLNLK